MTELTLVREVEATPLSGEVSASVAGEKPEGVTMESKDDQKSETADQGQAGESGVPASVPSTVGVKRKRTREVSPVDLLPTPPDTGHRRRKQPPRRVKSNKSEGGQ